MCLGASSIPWCRRPRDCNAAVLLPHHLEVHLLLLPALLQRKDVNPVTASAAMPVLRTPPPPRTKDAGPAVAQGRRIRCGLRLGAERTPVPSRQSSRAWRWRGCPRRLRQPRGTYVDPSPCLIVMCAMCLPHPPPPRPPHGGQDCPLCPCAAGARGNQQKAPILPQVAALAFSNRRHISTIWPRVANCHILAHRQPQFTPKEGISLAVTRSIVPLRHGGPLLTTDAAMWPDSGAMVACFMEHIRPGWKVPYLSA